MHFTLYTENPCDSLIRLASSIAKHGNYKKGQSFGFLSKYSVKTYRILILKNSKNPERKNLYK
ncbi:hypothetical protein BG08_7004 (plasmid) [Bacillus thuringiensis serovar kurstaki]|nr:hypothetical protein BG08_7028 [Bacillus thuringiensis serovar kurstaki]AJK38639.1 hypothetical protein BG08_7004 [Bacillus thuringiensis serovar kurstaki]